MEMKVCQSCGMPMGNTDELYATEKDGSKSSDYCKYCYQGGDFTFHGTMQEMMDFCVKPMLESDPTMTESQAREILNACFPTLKRWQKA
jgi:hypothetical protein